MNVAAGPVNPKAPVDSGLSALCGVSAYYRIAANPSELGWRRSLGDRPADFPDLVRAAKLLGLRARWVKKLGKQRFWAACRPRALSA
jgi:ATP-binding cassette, subfamily B, bacterial HlyB/CyaB